MGTDYLYADITKFERDENDDLIVYGKATGPDLDIDRQRMDPDWLKTAMPGWLRWGNVREQHSKIAAGIGIELEERDGGNWYLKTAVIDSETAKKVEKKVLKGYSIGIKDPRLQMTADAPKGTYVGGEIVEISLVDRPANPTCLIDVAKMAGGSWQPCDAKKAIGDDTVKCPTCDGKGTIMEGHRDCPDCHGDKSVTPEFADKLKARADKAAVAADMAKKDYSDDERAQLAKDGKALPIKNDKGEVVSGGYPIDTVADLQNAIRAFGRAKDPAATKSLITRRAKALGRSDLVPQTWKGAEKADAVSWTHDPALLAQVRDSLAQLLQAELDELQHGENEIGDIFDLAACLQTFMWWWGHEANDGEDPQPYPLANQEGTDMDFIALGVRPDVVKAAEADHATEEQKTALKSEVQKALGIDDESLVAKFAAASTESVKGLFKERDKVLEERFKRIEEKAAPGGPVTTHAPRASEADTAEVEARHFLALAASVDPMTAAGYREKAAEAQVRADRLRQPV